MLNIKLVYIKFTELWDMYLWSMILVSWLSYHIFLASGFLHVQLASEDIRTTIAYLSTFQVVKNEWCHLVLSYSNHQVRICTLDTDMPCLLPIDLCIILCTGKKCDLEPTLPTWHGLDFTCDFSETVLDQQVWDLLQKSCFVFTLIF